MKTLEMKAEMQRLSQTFEKHRPGLHGTSCEAIRQNQELMGLLDDMKALMQHAVFFEVLFNDGFNNCNGREWTLASPIVPLLTTCYDMHSFFAYADDDTVYSPQPAHPLSCTANKWIGSRTGLDLHLSSWLESHNPDEPFLGTFNIDLTKPSDVTLYEQKIQQLISQKAKAAVLFFVYDGTWVEPVFFMKHEHGSEVLLATNHKGSVSHLHEATKRLTTACTISATPCPNITVIHDGNCAIHSERNINAVLTEAFRTGNSVYAVLNQIKRNELSLDNFQVPLKKIAPENKSRTKPDPQTLHRLLCASAYLCFTLKAAGWIAFCREKDIHPLHIIKSYNAEWSTLHYSRLFSWDSIAQETPDSEESSREETTNSPVVNPGPLLPHGYEHGFVANRWWHGSSKYGVRRGHELILSAYLQQHDNNNQLRGDRLKRAILDGLKLKLETALQDNNLESTITQITGSSEYIILAERQCSLPGGTFFKPNTDSMSALWRMITDARAKAHANALNAA